MFMKCVVVAAREACALPRINNHKIGGDEAYGFKAQQYNPNNQPVFERLSTRTSQSPPIVVFAVEELIDYDRFKCDIRRSDFAYIVGVECDSTKTALNRALTGGITALQPCITYIAASLEAAA
jgi:hypothetical protein